MQSHQPNGQLKIDVKFYSSHFADKVNVYCEQVNTVSQNSGSREPRKHDKRKVCWVPRAMHLSGGCLIM